MRDFMSIHGCEQCGCNEFEGRYESGLFCRLCGWPYRTEPHIIICRPQDEEAVRRIIDSTKEDGHA